MAKIQRAILSVTDKSGLVDFAKKLAGMGVELISTGGTSKLLRENAVPVKDISDLTGFPEMLDGRVKTVVKDVRRLFPGFNQAKSLRRREDGSIRKITTWRR